TLGVLITEDQRGNCIEPAVKLGSSIGADVNCKAGSLSGAAASARLRSSEVHHRWLIWSAINSPTSTGRDSSCKGGSVSGEITSPWFVNTVRYHGKLRMSPASMPT